jgi:gas vesicle protein
MSDNPDEIRANIEATRYELSGNVDALADKVDPSKIAERQTEKIKGAFGSVKDRIMGAASDAQESAGSATDSVAGAGQKVAAKAQGNPLAVGLIAFGVGLLAASLIPATSQEKKLASDLKDKAQPLVEQATDAAKEVVGNLKQPAQDAAAAVKDTATDAAAAVKDEATGVVSDVKDQAADSKQALQNDN